MRIETKIGIAFALAFALMLLIGGLTYANSRALLAQNQAVTHTYDVLSQLDAMLNVAQDVETGMRGYIIGKRDDLLAPYQTALAEFPGRGDALRRLVSDNPGQVANVDELLGLMRRRIENAQGRVELRRRTQSLDEILPVLTDGSGQRAMDAVRAQIQRMRGAETDLLALRTRRFEQSGRNLQIAFGLLMLVATLMLAFFYWLVRKDFARRQRATALVEANERRFRALLESAPDAMILADAAGTVTLVNSAFERLFGYRRLEAVGRSLRDFVAERAGVPLPADNDDADAVPVTSENGSNAGDGSALPFTIPPNGAAMTAARLPTQRELRHLQSALPAARFEGVRQDGRRFPADLTFNPLEFAGPEGGTEATQQSIIAVRDRTEQQAAEDKLRTFSDDLARSNAELERFAYVASHDLQEPLRMVSSYTQLLSRRYKGKLDASADEFIAYAVDGATRMQTLINDLLTYSRVGSKPREFAPVNTEVVLQRVLHDMQGTLEAREATVHHPDPLPPVMGDAVQIGQVLQNLIGNATKFRRPEEASRVEITVRRESEGRFWLFSVKDNGIGIDPRYFERIFVIFQRLHTKQEYAGTGIGLAICKKVVERHGGRLWVESEPNQGANFLFTLPAAEA